MEQIGFNVKRTTQLKPMLDNQDWMLGTMAAFNPYIAFNSASRQLMGAGFIQQTLVPYRPDLPLEFTGYEAQLSEHSFRDFFPCDAEIISIMPKYSNTLTLVKDVFDVPFSISYQEVDTGITSIIEVDPYCSNHNKFGYKNILNPIIRTLRPGSYVPAGLRIAESAAHHDGLYSSTVNLNTLFCSHEGTIEDGYVLNRARLKDMAPTAVESRTAKWGEIEYPVMIYGPVDKPRPHPLPGEAIRGDGLVFCTRQYDDLLDVVNMIDDAITEPFGIGELTVCGEANAVVYDVDIVTATTGKNHRTKTPMGMEKVPHSFWAQKDDYNRRLITLSDKLVARAIRDKQPLKMSPELQNAVVRAYGDKPDSIPAKQLNNKKLFSIPVKRTIRKQPIDDWNVTVFYQFQFEIKEGAKLGIMAGGKGVVCRIENEEDMPIDEFGNRVDIMVYERSVSARLNPGQLYEQFSNAFKRDIRKDVIKMIDAGDSVAAWAHLERAYRVAYPEMIAYLDLDNISEKDKLMHMDDIIEDAIRVKITPSNSYVGKEWFKNIMAFRAPDMGRMTYTNFDGTPTTTDIPMLCGIMRYMVLEKCDYKAFAASTTRLQNHGLPCAGNRSSKHLNQVNHKAGRVFSESETRAHSNILGGEPVSALIELTNNPDATEAAVRTLMTKEKPLMEETLVDPSIVARGGSRSMALIDQELLCQGIEIAR